jgi:next-to-BRCA1 protein 1
MHPTCPDFDLCSNCESHPIPIHPLQHPLLKMKTIDTVIPTVYRVGSTVMIPSPSERVKAKQTAAPVELTTPPVDVSVPEMPRDIEMTGIAIAEPERVKTVVYTGPLVDVSIVSDARSQLSHLLAPAVEATTGQDQTLVDTSVPEIPATPSTLSKEALLASPVQAPADAPVSQGSTRQQMLDIISRSEADLVEQASSMTMPGGMPEEASPVLRVQNLTLEEPIVAPQMSARVDAPRVSLPIATFTPTLAVPSPKLLAAEVPKAATPPPPAPAAPLRAAFVSDLNIPDGQIFPPGAEFVKSWVLSNDGEREWPEKTELRYVAGDRMGDEGKIVVGGVGARTTVTVSTPELKVRPAAASTVVTTTCLRIIPGSRDARPLCCVLASLRWRGLRLWHERLDRYHRRGAVAGGLVQRRLARGVVRDHAARGQPIYDDVAGCRAAGRVSRIDDDAHRRHVLDRRLGHLTRRCAVAARLGRRGCVPRQPRRGADGVCRPL